MPDRAVWIDGVVRRGADAAISLFDRGARDGEGLFETLRVRDGRPFLWERHLERLVLGAAELGFPVPPGPTELRHGLDELLGAAGLAEAVVRITLTRGIPGGRPTRPGCWIDVEPVAARLWRAQGPRAIVSRRPFVAGPLGAYKTTSRIAYHLAREEARAAGADEAILVSPAGDVLEGAASNVFAVVGSELVTPPLAAGILPGITRELLIRRGPVAGLEVRQRRLAVVELLDAAEVVLTNAVQGVAPLAALGERRLQVGPIGARLRALYDEAVTAG